MGCALKRPPPPAPATRQTLPPPTLARAQIANFAAVVDLVPNADPSDESIRLVPHPIFDGMAFANLQQLSAFSGRDGYSGA